MGKIINKEPYILNSWLMFEPLMGINPIKYRDDRYERDIKQ